jgi:hypothetical protein
LGPLFDPHPSAKAVAPIEAATTTRLSAIPMILVLIIMCVSCGPVSGEPTRMRLSQSANAIGDPRLVHIRRGER